MVQIGCEHHAISEKFAQIRNTHSLDNGAQGCGGERESESETLSKAR